MQKCLNDDASHFFRQFKKYPILPVLLLLFIASSITMLVVALLCNTTYPCTYIQQDISLYFGLIFCVFCVVFIGFPCCLRFILNGIYYEPPVLPLTRMSPIIVVTNSPKQRPRSRSNSREKIPPSPKVPIPKHGMKSFKEFYLGV